MIGINPGYIRSEMNRRFLFAERIRISSLHRHQRRRTDPRLMSARWTGNTSICSVTYFESGTSHACLSERLRSPARATNFPIRWLTLVRASGASFGSESLCRVMEVPISLAQILRIWKNGPAAKSEFRRRVHFTDVRPTRTSRACVR